MRARFLGPMITFTPRLCVCVKLVKLDTYLCGVDGWDGGGKKKNMIVQVPLYQNVTNICFIRFMSMVVLNLLTDHL